LTRSINDWDKGGTIIKSWAQKMKEPIVIQNADKNSKGTRRLQAASKYGARNLLN
jgi:hypothetical protein